MHVILSQIIRIRKCLRDGQSKQKWTLESVQIINNGIQLRLSLLTSHGSDRPWWRQSMRIFIERCDEVTLRGPTWKNSYEHVFLGHVNLVYVIKINVIFSIQSFWIWSSLFYWFIWHKIFYDWYSEHEQITKKRGSCNDKHEWKYFLHQWIRETYSTHTILKDQGGHWNPTIKFKFLFFVFLKSLFA